MYEITEDSAQRYLQWVRDQDAGVAKRQGRSQPYYGCCGGAYVWRVRVHPDGKLDGWVTNDMTHAVCEVEPVAFEVPKDVRERFDAFKDDSHTYVWLSCLTSLGGVLKVLDETTGEETDFTDYDW